MKQFLLAYILAFPLLIFGQSDLVFSVPFTSEYWKSYGKTVFDFEQFEGRESIKLNGKVFVKGISLENGVIEVDVFAHSKRSFGGIVFRKSEHTMEDVYMRMHKSNQADAVQYTPIFNGESSWQLYKEFQANVSFKQGSWNNLKIEFFDKIATIHLNGIKIMTIESLKTDQLMGEIGLFSLGENRFSNFKYTKLSKEIAVDTKAVIAEIDPNIITEWSVSDAIIYKGENPNPEKFAALSYKKVATEHSGLLPISKYIKKPSFGNFEDNEEVYAVASYTLKSDVSSFKKFSFDFSDKILVFLNGKLLFEGNNAFRSKGEQFQGHLSVHGNTLNLPLKKGKNVIHCVVIDKANGWGLIGKLDK